MSKFKSNLKDNPKSCLASKLFFIFAVFVNSACTNPNRGDSIDLNELIQPNSSSIFTSAKLVKLQASPESMIATISQVEYFDEHYYVFDRRQQTIFCFNKEGNFKFKLHEQGHGPGEYVYLQSFTVDRINKKLILLCPSMAELVIFDLDGKFLTKKSLSFEEPIGFNSLYMLDGNTLLISSIARYQSILYCLEDEIIKESFFEIPSRTGALMPAFNTYQSADSVFVMPYLDSKVFSFNTSGPDVSFELNFGKDNNSTDQIEIINSLLLNETPSEPLRWQNIVGKGRYLNHHILKIMESTRFRLAIIVHDDAIKHLIIDKKTDNVYLFKEFAEGYVIHLMSSIQDNIMISFDLPYSSNAKAKEMHGSLAPYFTANYFDINSLGPECQELLKSHDLLLDNPFLIVHEFIE